MMMNWIDVGDRLPKISDDNKHDKKHVIIVVNEGNDRYVTEGWYGWQQELECDIYCQETWVWHKVFSDGERVRNVTHWMPMPGLPKGWTKAEIEASCYEMPADGKTFLETYSIPNDETAPKQAMMVRLEDKNDPAWTDNTVYDGKNMIFVGSRTPEALALAHHYAELHNLEVLGWTTYEDKDYIDGRHCF